jgi:hypothetical protein
LVAGARPAALGPGPPDLAHRKVAGRLERTIHRPIPSWRGALRLLTEIDGATGSR